MIRINRLQRNRSVLRIVLVSVAAVAVTVLAILGLRGQTSTDPPILLFNDMVEQPKYKSQSESDFFADGRSMRLPPAGTVPFGRSISHKDDTLTQTDARFYTLQYLPTKIDLALLLGGQRLFSTYCAVCHGGTGKGNGITTQYGMNNPPSYHIDRLRAAPDGYLYQVITEGKNTMPAYGPNVHPADRIAIIAYVRALQRANNARLDDLPPALRGELK